MGERTGIEFGFKHCIDTGRIENLSCGCGELLTLTVGLDKLLAGWLGLGFGGFGFLAEAAVIRLGLRWFGWIVANPSG